MWLLECLSCISSSNLLCIWNLWATILFTSLVAPLFPSNVWYLICSASENQIVKLILTLNKIRINRISSSGYQVSVFLYMNSVPCLLVPWSSVWFNCWFSLCSGKVKCYSALCKCYQKWQDLRNAPQAQSSMSLKFLNTWVLNCSH